MDKTLGSKNLYKIFILASKYVPMICAIIQIIGLVLNYIGIHSTWISFFGGTSLLFVALLYLISYVFRFCYLYRLPLHYIVVINIIIALNLIIGIPAITYVALRLCMLLTGIFIISYVIILYKNRNNPKVDYIKQLCNDICD